MQVHLQVQYLVRGYLDMQTGGVLKAQNYNLKNCTDPLVPDITGHHDRSHIHPPMAESCFESNMNEASTIRQVV